ncbi:glycosyl hydrolase [Prolixibacteraceae bacterium Z1-6]|uniref:Glycosyl hydrolase n=1 Tax=Draconibacterium aestuarii TaxID=2998507 RepID=A0A9X3F4T1_9BACT|nr:glycosyl hydrolase [Prolixibacteraceae bacterium Z1-6]
MRKIFQLALILLALQTVMSCSTNEYKRSNNNLESGFVTPPDSIQIGVYWLWISDHISKEGVEKDLYAMKKAGITRAFIGNIGLDNVPEGNVKMFSDVWWDILHVALKTATDLNIDIGIFNSPGWSQSGGPWVKPEEAMRYLATSELRVSGPKKINLKLDKPTDFFQDVKTLAYPVSKEDKFVLNTTNAEITSIPKITHLKRVFDGNKKTGIDFPKGDTFTIDVTAKEPLIARSLLIRTTEKKFKANAIFQVKETNGAFRTISEFEIDRSNSSLNVGFEPYAPVVVSLPEVTNKSFRLIISNYREGSGLTDLVISSAPRIDLKSAS